MPRIGVGLGLGLSPLVVAAGGYDADAQAFFDRVTTAGGTLTTTEKNATNQLVLDMKSAGIWSSMKAIYPMVGASAAACAQNVVSSSFTGTFSGGWTYASTGVTPNGTNGYMNTGFNPNSDSTVGSNDMHISAYTNSNLSGSNTNIIGAYDSRETGIAPKWSNGSFFAEINDNVFTNIGVSNSTSQGFYIANKNGTGNNIGYKNQSKVINGANLSDGKTNLNLYVGARNSAGSADRFASYTIQIISIGIGLNDTQASNLYTAVQAFQTTLSRQV